MKKLYNLFLLGALLAAFNMNAQRYLTPVFSNVDITDNVVYGQNYASPIFGGALSNLVMTVYEPTGDTVTDRPLFIYLHTGNFLPKGVNQTTTGTRSDSSVVEICTRLAQRGYVVASIDYRLGWNPAEPNQDRRTQGLLRAVYRAIQDSRTAVRYFRKDVATNNNQYGIDPLRIAVMGAGSGGYVALATTTLDDPAEIQLTKFYNFTDNVPMVDPDTLGSYDGVGGNPAKNKDNHLGYSSNVALCVNLGGAIGDSSWQEAGEVPMVAFHCPNDPFAPYKAGTVIVPTTGDFVVAVNGSYDVIKVANELGNNALFDTISDATTTIADSKNDGHEGLYPFMTATPQNAPWDWWNPADPLDSLSSLTNPDMSAAKGKLYIDTIMDYLVPRAYIALVTAPAPALTEPASTNEVKGSNQLVKVYPNPAVDQFIVEASEAIKSVQIFNISGQLVTQKVGNNQNKYILDRSGLPSGIYYTEVETVSSKQVVKLLIK